MTNDFDKAQAEHDLEKQTNYYDDKIECDFCEKVIPEDEAFYRKYCGKERCVCEECYENPDKWIEDNTSND